MNLLKNHLFIFALISLLSCSSDSNDSDGDSNNASGTITLSGEETSVLGTTLKVAKIIEGAEQTGTSLSVTLLHENVKIVDGEIVPTNATDGFIIGVVQYNIQSVSSNAVSMAIVVNGEEYKFGCATPKVGDFIACGSGFDVDHSGNKVTFNNTTVMNTETGKILTMNGVVTW